KVDPKVVKEMIPYFGEVYGNASSTHTLGQSSKDALELARKVIAKSIGAKTEEIIFTSGGTESNNLAIKGIAFANKSKGNHIIITKIEHDCVLRACEWLEKQGFEITYLNVDREGFVKEEDLEKAIRSETILVSIIQGNNEIGTIQNLERLGKICRANGIYLHTDACQSYTKTELNVEKQNLDLVSLNAHKIHGPKGVGALYLRRGIKITPWKHGGGHEFGLRAGTENVPGVVGFAEAVKLGMNKKHVEFMTRLRDKLVEGVLKIPGTQLNGSRGDQRLCNNANFSFKSIEGEALGGYLDQKWVCSSTGSACSSRTLEPSHVLKAIGLRDEEAHGSLRLTLSRFNTEKEIDYVLKILPKIVEKLRKISPLGRLSNVL
ncbi:cysteine desulfurase, partial [Candidatus Woesearchaeota archaeon]|nr:cysteine desulfurase [Candidatus Woesearchaeota archaeon]